MLMSSEISGMSHCDISALRRVPNKHGWPHPLAPPLMHSDAPPSLAKSLAWHVGRLVACHAAFARSNRCK